MTDIQIFNYQNNEVRTVEMNGEPWFVLKDVCEVLGLTDTGRTAERLDPDELTRTTLVSGGQNREMFVINESGLYNVILRSDKPEAKPFCKWVTSEVLPSIRKHGAYMTPASKELQAIFVLDNRSMQHEKRITALENSMTADYNQQRILRRTVSNSVRAALGGTDAPAYTDRHVRDKVYSECNRDVQDWFRVNSVGNIPRKRFDEAVEYIQRWKPSTNTVMLIQQTNGQTCLFDRPAV